MPFRLARDIAKDFRAKPCIAMTAIKLQQSLQIRTYQVGDITDQPYRQESQ